MFLILVGKKNILMRRCLNISNPDLSKTADMRAPDVRDTLLRSELTIREFFGTTTFDNSSTF